jgi:hypothetical protein
MVIPPNNFDLDFKEMELLPLKLSLGEESPNQKLREPRGTTGKLHTITSVALPIHQTKETKLP